MNTRICNQDGQSVDHHENMRRTALVVVITLITMIAEILYGIISGSMALLADGIHMGTHTFALIVTLIAYKIAQTHKDNPNFAFSSGKVGVLGGYTNAILLGITAIYMIWEAIKRLITPEPIIFIQALSVAVIGLVVNLISAALLSGGTHHHHHGHDHDHDHNLRAAYVHVITDALTSVLAIIALLTGYFFDYTWPDAAVAILGAIVILKWAYGLLLSSGRLLVDYHDSHDDLRKIQRIAEGMETKVLDVHIWHTSENRKAVIAELIAGKDFDREAFSEEVEHACHADHITLAVR